MRRIVPLLGLALLASCGGRSQSEAEQDPLAQNVAAAAAEGTSARVAAAIDCSNKPDFVPVYADARITTCIAGPDRPPNHVAGTIVYMSDAEPGKLLGWSRAHANASGLAPRLATPTSYSAGEEARRSLMILVEPKDGATRVTVNWGTDL